MFIAVSDTGYVSNGSGLSQVASSVQAFCADEMCQFGLMAGDDVYDDGAAGNADDAQLFRTRFTKPYGGLESQG